MTSLVFLVFAAVVGIIGLGVGTYLYYARELPPPSRIGDYQKRDGEKALMSMLASPSAVSAAASTQ